MSSEIITADAEGADRLRQYGDNIDTATQEIMQATQELFNLIDEYGSLLGDFRKDLDEILSLIKEGIESGSAPMKELKLKLYTISDKIREFVDEGIKVRK